MSRIAGAAGPISRGIVAVVAGGLLLSGCASSGGGGATPAPSGPSGSLGIVTVADARRAVQGLCEIEAKFARDLGRANATFYDVTHQELHVIAAAAEVVDRLAAARLLQAKETVESDLAALALPGSFLHDVKALAAATLAALDALGVRVTRCAS